MTRQMFWHLTKRCVTMPPGQPLQLFRLLCILASLSAVVLILPIPAHAAPNSITLTWTAPGDDGSIGTATAYDIRYSTATINDANWGSATQVSSEPIPKSAGASETYTVTGLQPSTTYYIALKTVDEAGNWSVLSNVAVRTTTAEVTPPAAIANLVLSTPTPNSLTLSWTAPGDDSLTGTSAQYDIRYSTALITSANWASATQATGEPAPKAAGQSESFTLTGLNTNTLYYVAIKTADEVPNLSALSNVPSLSTTPENSPPAPIANLLAASSTPLSVTLTWTAPGDDSLTGTATTYDIRYSTSLITSANWGSATQATGEPAPKAAGQSESFAVLNLTPATTYYFAIKTSDEVPNVSGLSNVVSRATGSETIPPATIASLTAAASTASSVTLTWTAPGDDGTTGTATTYDVRYATAAITDVNWSSATQVNGEPAPQAAGQSETFTVTGLNSSTTYFFAVRTADEVPNWSATSNSPSRATLTESIPPAAIANLSSSGVTDHGVTLTWTASGDDSLNGTAAGYDIRYSLTPINVGNWAAATQVSGEPNPKASGQSESFTVNGLEASRTYYFAIVVRDEVPNLSALSNIYQVTTAPDQTPPGAVIDLGAVTGSLIGEALLSWTAPGDDISTGRATTYEIRYSQTMITTGNWNNASQLPGPPVPQPAGNTQQLVISGLVPAQRYYFGIKASDEVGNQASISNIANAVAGFNIGTGTEDMIVTLDFPATPVTLASTRPTLTVNNFQSQSVAMIAFEIASDSLFANLIDQGSLPPQAGTRTSWQPTVALNAATDYFWRAQADNFGYSRTGQFRVEPKALAYPNPYVASRDAGITFTDLAPESDLFVVSAAGSPVMAWTSLPGSTLSWNVTNDAGSPLASGIYLWYAPKSGSSGKIVVVR